MVIVLCGIPGLARDPIKEAVGSHHPYMIDEEELLVRIGAKGSKQTFPAVLYMPDLNESSNPADREQLISLSEHHRRPMFLSPHNNNLDIFIAAQNGTFYTEVYIVREE
jgi:hypothetical protein